MMLLKVSCEVRTATYMTLMMTTMKKVEIMTAVTIFPYQVRQESHKHNSGGVVITLGGLQMPATATPSALQVFCCDANMMTLVTFSLLQSENVLEVAKRAKRSLADSFNTMVRRKVLIMMMRMVVLMILLMMSMIMVCQWKLQHHGTKESQTTFDPISKLSTS